MALKTKDLKYVFKNFGLSTPVRLCTQIVRRVNPNFLGIRSGYPLNFRGDHGDSLEAPQS
jgi:hypothetical protein